MFTLEQIEQAHQKVQTGADFPQYFKDIAALGVTSIDTFVENGIEVYRGSESFELISEPKYANLAMNKSCNLALFKKYLKIHQLGETDFPMFCDHAAETGILKWEISIKDKTCTYFKHENEPVLTENIPA